MVSVKFYNLNTIENSKLKFAVIMSRYKDKWIFVKHKDRITWEIPGGHREKGESIEEAGKRELVEETGAKRFSISPICEYSVSRNEKISYGRLFYSEVQELGELFNEIEEVRLFEDIPVNLTYPEIQPELHRKLEELRERGKVDIESIDSAHVL